MKKTFVILEQGCEPNYPLTTKHKQQFNTEFSDCFRLNWKADTSDKNADFFKRDICWSEGRSHLYEQVKGKYDYYIFIDDDVDIESDTDLNPAEEIKKLLEKYKPIHGSIVSNHGGWPNFNENSPPPHGGGVPTSEVFQMKSGDLCIQLFSENYANLVFPTWLHGSGRSMWYAQFIPYILCPGRSVFLNSVRIKNTRMSPHQDENLSQFSRHDTCHQWFQDRLKLPEHKHIFKHWDLQPDMKDRVKIKPENEMFDTTNENLKKLLT